ncbi:MAG TPA: M56 family metallopeptidase, partial [Hyphomonadaceae bacterium]
MSEIALRFLLANLAAAVAIILVLALRRPARAAFGARLAYGLWLLVPLAALGSLLPPRVVEIARPAPAMTASYPPPSIAPDFLPAAPAFTSPEPTSPDLSALPGTPDPRAPDPLTLLVIAWLAGCVAMLAWQLRNQSRFMIDARAGFAGPAVVGFLRPRIVTPSDFEDRFEHGEREVIIAHETIHLRRNDARINALVALVRCICWFNPLVHIAAHLMRIDQELACDATVVERHPKARATYASALLKAQLAARPLPLGCYWPAGTEHPLTERVEMLKQMKPTR